MIDDEKELEVKEALPDYDRLYTVEDYHSWDEDFRAELYEGTLIVLERPTPRHQSILMEISGQLWQFLKGKTCKLYPAPFAVQPFDNEQTLFEPDITVVCDKTKIIGRTHIGGPDFIVEILSPSTARRDKKLKYYKYEKAGVREYWIVDPERNLLEANRLVNNKYILTIYDETDKAPVSVLDGFEIDLADVLAE